jgi:hypothetical protein
MMDSMGSWEAKRRSDLIDEFATAGRKGTVGALRRGASWLPFLSFFFSFYSSSRLVIYVCIDEMRNVFLWSRQLAGWGVVGVCSMRQTSGCDCGLLLCCAVRAVDLKNALEETKVGSGPNRGRVTEG